MGVPPHKGSACVTIRSKYAKTFLPEPGNRNVWIMIARSYIYNFLKLNTPYPWVLFFTSMYCSRTTIFSWRHVEKFSEEARHVALIGESATGSDNLQRHVLARN